MVGEQSTSAAPAGANAALVAAEQDEQASALRTLGLCVGSGLVKQRVESQSAEAREGWVWVRSREAEAMHRMYAQIIHFIRDVEVHEVRPDVGGEEGSRVLSDPLEACPEPEDNPEYYEQIERPTSLQTITHRVASCEYAEPALFMQDMLQLFANARTWYGLGTEGYGETCILQRLFQQLTRSRTSLHDGLGTRHIRHRASDIDVVNQQRAEAKAANMFASSNYGPLREPPTTAEDISGRIDVPTVVYQGCTYGVGDWVHLMNPVDPERPIVAQVFRLYKRRDVPGDFLTACWYYRPEQTSHAATRQFMPSEVVKSSVYAEHAMEDILENILVLFRTKYTLGRPRAPYWDSNTPLYVVDSKYDPARHQFARINSWASCVPSEIRSVHTPMDVFPKPSALPPKEASPLLEGVRGPAGELLDKGPAEETDHEHVDLFHDALDADALRSAPDTGPGAPPQQAQREPYPAGMPANHPDRVRAYIAFHEAARNLASRTSPESYATLQRELTMHPFAQRPELVALAARCSVPEALLFGLRDAALAAGVLSGSPPEPSQPTAPGFAAVLAANRGEATFAEVPPATRMYHLVSLAITDPTGALFHADESGKLLWYGGAPLGGWHPAAAMLDGNTRVPLPSLDYLYEQARRTHSNQGPYSID